jgi:RimJ/RimL family protein N-acetyltransferase
MGSSPIAANRNVCQREFEMTNALGQPIGLPLPGWKPPPKPPRAPFDGQWCRLEPLNLDRHAEALHQANSTDDERGWTYLAYGPFRSVADYREWLTTTCLGDDPLFFVICIKPDYKPVGLASFLNIAPASGSIEVGHLRYSPALQRTPAATDAMYLMMKQAFHLGYRRYEWKCNSLNAASRAAALRLGFTFEGIFRQAAVHKGRNRDTAWYSVIDSEWPDLRAAFEAWLQPSNFDSAGRQRKRLSDMRQST